MRIKEVADLVGISVRTLHHYDEIGLLKPDKIADSGYRIYTEENLEMLQQILFFRELDVPLKDIKRIVQAPDYDRYATLELHRSMLLEKRARLDRVLSTLDRTLKHERGEIAMSQKEKFAGFKMGPNRYEEEARKRWGDQAVEASNTKLKAMGTAGQQAWMDEMNAVYKELAVLRHGSPASDEAQAAIKAWYELLNRMGSYSYEAFKGLGQMYVDDDRFTQSIDQFGAGLAVFMRDAMAIFADQHMAR